jgi:tetratricopeptide (TPR) repeat protein
MLRRIWSIGILIVLATSRAVAHDDDITLRVIDGKLARGEGRATDLLVRAEIERADGRWAEAAASLDRAALLIPNSGRLALCRAGLAADQGCPVEVLRVLDACPDPALATDPRVPWMRAEALRRLGRLDEAAAAMDVALARDQAATAEHFLARSQVAERRPVEGAAGAIRVLEAGLERWPRAWNLASRLVDLEAEAGRWDAALARLDAVIAVAARPERLLAQRGDLLARAGRPWEAREAWTVALAGLESRGAKDAASRDLESRLRTSLSEPPPTARGAQP